ncbi:hypothetical protein ACX2QB_08060 [Weissella viridescens]
MNNEELYSQMNSKLAIELAQAKLDVAMWQSRAEYAEKQVAQYQQENTTKQNDQGAQSTND